MTNQYNARVPTVEGSLKLDLCKLRKASKAMGNLLTVSGCEYAGMVLLHADRLVFLIEGKTFIADIVMAPCLGSIRVCFRCPRAHTGHVASLYYRLGELGCRKCLSLRYNSILAPTTTVRKALGRVKQLASLGARPPVTIRLLSDVLGGVAGIAGYCPSGRHPTTTA